MDPMDLTLVIPTCNEAENLDELLPQVNRLCQRLGLSHEVLIPDAGSSDRTADVARAHGANVFVQEHPGYGEALREAFVRSRGAYIITLDADLSHNPNVIRMLWRNRHRADILIASRYVRYGHSRAPWTRRLPSVFLNRVFARVLSLPVQDLSSGFRLYRRDVLDAVPTTMSDFSMLQELLLGAHVRGFLIGEVPFHYFPRRHGASKARFWAFGLSYARLLGRSWMQRNSIEAADYDERAFYSIIPFQRLWQRKRYEVVTEMLESRELILDIGCGSSKILEAVPNGIGVDLNFEKLRYRKLLGVGLLQADVRGLPFKDRSVDEILCSELIEHVPKTGRPLEELERILKPGGVLILGTPDYGRASWRWTEAIYKRVMPQGYGDEHIGHYTKDELLQTLKGMGFRILDVRYVYWSELIIKAVLESQAQA